MGSGWLWERVCYAFRWHQPWLGPLVIFSVRGDNCKSLIWLIMGIDSCQNQFYFILEITTSPGLVPTNRLGYQNLSSVVKRSNDKAQLKSAWNFTSTSSYASVAWYLGTGSTFCLHLVCGILVTYITTASFHIPSLTQRLHSTNIRGCIQTFPDKVHNEVYAYLWYYLLRSNTKGYGGKSH
jgi:hypothetical protein